MVNGDEIGALSFAGYSVIVSVKPTGLHDGASVLLSNLSDGVKRLEPFCESIFLFYGLCRSTKYDIKRFIEDRGMALTFLTEEDGSVADDCFGAVLGSRRRYLEMMNNNKGTMFITTGYAEHWAMKQANKWI